MTTYTRSKFRPIANFDLAAGSGPADLSPDVILAGRPQVVQATAAENYHHPTALSPSSGASGRKNIGPRSGDKRLIDPVEFLRLPSSCACRKFWTLRVSNQSPPCSNLWLGIVRSSFYGDGSVSALSPTADRDLLLPLVLRGWFR
jgi:hypothetical protein